MIDEQWSHWKRVHNKQYTSDEEHDRRRGHWIQNLLTVMQHNVNHDLGLVTYSMGLNVFSDLSGNEFRDLYVNGYRSDLRKTLDDKSGLAIPFNMSEIGDIPESVDWRDHGLVVEVKNQGQCGSCWAFSTTGALEGQYAKKYGKQMEFSEQQLVDCTRRYGNHGCHGGSFEKAFEYLETYGLEPEAVYPYEAHDERCKYDGRKATVTVKSYSTLRSGNEQMLKAMVASHGPVSVAVDAHQFQQYSGGIFGGTLCSATHLNHAVLVVGYGLEKGVPYWIIKNSWSPEWGEKGYMRLIRDRGNTCGIATDASVPEIN
ncbi:Secreted cathepsin L 2 [Fasciola hepatica]|uniref:Secreted cathepsin L 2 n=1 Tax=Fasciola hepatica TaxID=6192 RepID=A0A2H1C2U2_FASHE|nr:Secreted cathepsin L 2 [Fasciola hepatica]